ncbi:WD40-repeat-containing domain protein [Polychytrium aggregatum]|uniref:WD40-repeat-containing domain protein n=1 Tax=Polychytrium aggregatum TaxID=110093 RepID=UPI0022FF3B27|nr:WD40-repeat-containing domain protein [Polychytrium aggregatum]KAI9204449.1 WD40-repeat-containing domain protein [Polychytrium aggregatum]
MGKRKSTHFNNAAPQSATAREEYHQHLAAESFLLSAFDSPSVDYFAAVFQAVDAHRLKIWDTRTSSLSFDMPLPKGDKCTCIAWGIQGAEDSSLSKKEKKRRRSSLVANDKLVAIGLGSGNVALFSVNRGEILRTFSGGHTAAVSDFVFSADGSRGYSAGEDGEVVVWEIKSGTAVSHFKADSKALRKIQLNSDGDRLLTAGHQIKLWDADSHELLQTFTGHATLVSRLLFSSDDKYAVSSAEEDRFVSVWDCLDRNSNGNLTALTLDASPTHLAVSIKNQALALTESGVVALWQTPFVPPADKATQSKKKYVPRTPESTLQFSTPDGKPISILAATFVGDKIIVARGTIIRPVFERLSYADETGKLIPKLELTRSPTSAILVDESSLAEQALKSNRKEYSDADSRVLGAADFSMATPALAEDLEEKLAKEPTLEDRLNIMAINPSPSAKSKVALSLASKSKTFRPPTASSLHHMLTQAVHSGDKQLLERCLEIKNPDIILATVRRLPTAQIVPFLEQLVDKLQKRPNRATVLIEWVRAVILVHAAYLMTVPNLVKQLSLLYQTLDSRVNVFSKMLKLSGRLDLVLSQIAMRTKGGSGDVDGEEEAMAVYDEEYEDDDVSDDEMMEFVGGSDEEDEEEDDGDDDDDDEDLEDEDDFDPDELDEEPEDDEDDEGDEDNDEDDEDI